MNDNPTLRALAAAASMALLLTAIAVPVTAADPATACKDGGWKSMQTADGQSFKNQGQCVAYLVHQRNAEGEPLVVAYSDLDGDGHYTAGDVLIAMLVDTDRSNDPSANDTIIVDRYPLDLDASAFGTWLRTAPQVIAGAVNDPGTVEVWDADGCGYIWDSLPSRELYQEFCAGTEAAFQDWRENDPDRILVQAGSPSDPDTPVPSTTRTDYDDDAFLNVDILYVGP